MADSLLVRDGNGNFKNLEVISGSVAGNVVPVHAITGSVTASISSTIGTNPVYVSSSALYPVVTALSGVTLVNGSVPVTGTLGVDVVIGDEIKISSSATQPVWISSSANTPVFITASYTIPVNGTLTTAADYAASVVTGSYTFSSAQTAQTVSDPAAKTLTITNQANNMLFITLDGQAPSPTNYSLAIDPFSTYEAIAQNARLTHKFILTGSANAGRVVYTITK